MTLNVGHQFKLTVCTVRVALCRCCNHTRHAYVATQSIRRRVVSVVELLKIASVLLLRRGAGRVLYCSIERHRNEWRL